MQLQLMYFHFFLFLQVGNRSSEFHPEVRRVRREGSYIYEEFMPTGGTDVKVPKFILQYRSVNNFSLIVKQINLFLVYHGSILEQYLCCLRSSSFSVKLDLLDELLL